jgi:hypothetical protein
LSALSKVALKIPFLLEMLAWTAQQELEKLPLAVRLYFHTYKALEGNNELQYQQAKQALKEAEGQFLAEDLGEMYVAAVNFCIRRINIGERNYANEVFDLYKTGLANNALLSGGRISRYSYKNIASSAMMLGEYEWAKKFLLEYQAFLPEKERENTFKYNLAVWHFRQQQYDAAMTLLQDSVQHTDVLYGLDVRRMLTRIYCEQEEWTALQALLDSYRMFLQRHKNLGYHRENHLKFIRFVQRFAQLRPGDEDEKTQLRENVVAENSVLERQWLLGILG